MIGFISHHVRAAPATHAFFLLCALAVSYVLANALFLQEQSHPAPLAKSVSFLDSPVRSGSKRRAVANSPVPLPPVRSDVPEPDTSAAAILTELQIEMTRMGFYKGPVDGLPGPLTNAAIAAFEVKSGKATAGLTNAQLLAQLREWDAQQERLSPQSVSYTPSMARAELEETLERSLQPRDADASETENEEPETGEPIVRVIQEALAKIGYGPGAIDGIYGAETENAIKEFEVDRGLPETGLVSMALIQELERVTGERLVLR
ncbi:MAG: peptidoglycan-binding protein [Hyphomicrobiales bacterium]|nr:peptidoglycan-binding protein [Hyphomicrobiales bacterium]